MKPCISEATTMPSSFAEDVAAYADAGCAAMEVWLTKLEQHLQSHSLADTRRLLRERGMTLVAAAYQGACFFPRGNNGRPISSISGGGSICASNSEYPFCS